MVVKSRSNAILSPLRPLRLLLALPQDRGAGLVLLQRENVINRQQVRGVMLVGMLVGMVVLRGDLTKWYDKQRYADEGMADESIVHGGSHSDVAAV
ncbi:MAG: hypothetical protein CMJ85_00125 [Planctomycetes bacterium]|jgi:hypothetical protein|nr:hypothetical protein [Planctomycetota bacterium]